MNAAEFNWNFTLKMYYTYNGVTKWQSGGTCEKKGSMVWWM